MIATSILWSQHQISPNYDLNSKFLNSVCVCTNVRVSSQSHIWKRKSNSAEKIADYDEDFEEGIYNVEADEEIADNTEDFEEEVHNAKADDEIANYTEDFEEVADNTEEFVEEIYDAKADDGIAWEAMILNTQEDAGEGGAERRKFDRAHPMVKQRRL